MNTKNLLDQLLQGINSSTPQSTEGLSTLMSNKGGAALAGGALGLLIGSKSGRKMGGKVLTYGGLAVLGTLAYKAYQNYQQQSAGPAHNPMQPLERLPQNEVETHCKAILIALIAAAKADGHIADHEKQLIDQEVTKFKTSGDLQQWFDRELKKPLDPAEVAKHATTPAIAAEMYMASLLTVDEENFMEKSYLNELARQMNLPAALQTELAQQAKQALVGAKGAKEQNF
jgi:uncharacterized membrane protein YebE (DUF533 family)